MVSGFFVSKGTEMEKGYQWTWTVFDLYVSMKANNRERVEQLKHNIIVFCNSEEVVSSFYKHSISGEDRIKWVMNYVPIGEPEKLLHIYKSKVLENKDKLESCYGKGNFNQLCNYYCSIQDIVSFTNSLTCDIGCFLEAEKFIEPKNVDYCISCAYVETMKPTTPNGLRKSLFDPYIVETMDTVLARVNGTDEDEEDYEA